MMCYDEARKRARRDWEIHWPEKAEELVRLVAAIAAFEAACWACEEARTEGLIATYTETGQRDYLDKIMVGRRVECKEQAQAAKAEADRDAWVKVRTDFLLWNEMRDLG